MKTLPSPFVRFHSLAIPALVAIVALTGATTWCGVETVSEQGDRGYLAIAVAHTAADDRCEQRAAVTLMDQATRGTTAQAQAEAFPAAFVPAASRRRSTSMLHALAPPATDAQRLLAATILQI